MCINERFQKEAMGHYVSLPQTSSSCLYYLWYIYTYPHTQNLKKKLVLGTQLSIEKKYFFQFPLKCMRNAESQILPFNLHLPQINEKTMSTLIEYRVTWMDGY